jgi:hypothetical protein
MDEDRLSYLSDVGHWRHRADQARALASQIMDPQTRAAMLQIADGYKAMAKHAEARAVKGRTVGPTHYPPAAAARFEKLAP